MRALFVEDLRTWLLMGQPKGFPTGTAYVTGQSLDSTEEARIKTPLQAHSAGLRFEAYCVPLTHAELGTTWVGCSTGEPSGSGFICVGARQKTAVLLVGRCRGTCRSLREEEPHRLYHRKKNTHTQVRRAPKILRGVRKR